MDNFKFLSQVDAEMAEAISLERGRQEAKIELIASENFTSQAVMEAQGSVLTNKYAEGYPGHRYYGGCEFVDIAEDLARNRAKSLFKAEYVNVQPHSGAQANMAAYFVLLNPGDKVLGMALPHGGHLTHGSPVNFSGKQYQFTAYGVNPETEMLDYDEVRAIAKQTMPKLIVAGASAYPRIIDFPALRAIADEVGAKLMVDMAHIAGLVAADEHPSPIPYAHVTTTTTHKTLRGPRGGMIFSTADMGAALDKAVFPGIQGGPLMHVIAAKGVALKEAAMPEFKIYQQQVKKNAKVLAEQLMAKGIRLVSGGTDNHLLLVDTRSRNLTGKDAEHILDEAGITCNKNTIPFDPASPFVTSGIRLGTAAVTTRGMKEAEMMALAEAIDLCLIGGELNLNKGKAIVQELTAAFKLY